MRYRPWLCLALLLTLLALATDVHTQPRTGKPPIGNVEQIDGRGKVTGWSADEDRPSGPVEVVVTVDGADVGTVKTNIPRPDVTKAHPSLVGNHRFVF